MRLDMRKFIDKEGSIMSPSSSKEPMACTGTQLLVLGTMLA